MILSLELNKKRGDYMKKVSSKKVRRVKNPAMHARAKPDCCFVTLDGASFATLKELVLGLEHMNQDVFFYHVTKEKNDFANWIRDVLDDGRLSERVAEANDPEKAMIVMLKYMAGISK